MMTPLARRTFLRGAGGVVVALPMLEAMLPRRASAAAPPRRFVFFFSSNGVNSSAWTPTAGAGTQLTLSPVLMPLAPLQDKLVVLSGVNMETARNSPGNAHNVGMTNLLTARKFLVEKQTSFGAIGWGAGISLDQEIANRLGAATKFASLQFGVQTFKQYGANAYSYTSYAGPQKPVPCEDDPRKMFARLFSDVGSSAADQQARIDRRKSVLDFVAEDFRQLAVRLAADDRAKLDAHMTAVREIENRLGLKGQAASTCKQPAQTLPATFNVNSNDSFPQVGKLQMDLLTMALACDLTRSAVLQWSNGQSDTVHRWVGTLPGPQIHHGMSHQTDPATMDALQRIQTWYVQQLGYLGTQLAAVKEPGGSVLDNSVIVSCSEISVGPTHSFKDMPWLVLGGGGGTIKGNRWLKFTNGSHNDLYVSVMNALGIPATTFGDPTYCKGALPGLLA